jgi:hypothetical protein
VTLCLLTPDLPVLAPDQPPMLADGWICAPADSTDGHYLSSPTASTLTERPPLAGLTSTPRAGTLTSDLAD